MACMCVGGKAALPTLLGPRPLQPAPLQPACAAATPPHRPPALAAAKPPAAAAHLRGGVVGHEGRALGAVPAARRGQAMSRGSRPVN